MKFEELCDKVRELATTYPSATYLGEVCSYTRGDVRNGPETLGCIFGQAIRLLDPDLLETIGADCYYDHEAIDELLARGVISPPKEPSLASWASALQDQQDLRVPWGEALRLADEGL